jgi:hypothetical protein
MSWIKEGQELPEVPIATLPERLRIEVFYHQLKRLCSQYGFDLSHGYTGINVGLRDDQRPEELKKDWPYVASFTGIDQAGRSPLEIETYPVDQYTKDLLMRNGVLDAEGKPICR